MRLLLHVCCAPDATVALERIPQVERLRLFFDNPNIYPVEEFARRLETFLKFTCGNEVDYMVGDYDAEVWSRQTQGHEHDAEGGERCEICIGWRLDRTAQLASQTGFDTFGCVFTTSPHKRSALIHQLGESSASKYGLNYLRIDLKKKDGFRRSVELSRNLGLYRQNYCGCQYSLNDGQAASRKS
jgi:predicted adenine nucleotide alpha hydrolase (AANH) superfamily ATPase